MTHKTGVSFDCMDRWKRGMDRLKAVRMRDPPLRKMCMRDDVKMNADSEARILYASTSGENSDHPSMEERGREKNQDCGFTSSMVPELYRSAINGEIDAFENASEDPELSPFTQVSPRGNTVLHLAASSGHDQLVERILQQCPELVKRESYRGDLALHVAASGGHLSTVNCLILFSQKFVGSSTSRNCEAGETEVSNVLKKVNKEGNTALHAALENHHQKVAELLAKKDPTVSCYRNREEKSPLCLAAEAGYLELIKLMMVNERVDQSDNPNEELKGKSAVQPVESHSITVDEPVRSDINPNENLKGIPLPKKRKKKKKKRGIPARQPDEQVGKRPKGKSPLHAAIVGRNTDVLDMIWSKNPALINSIDEEGRKPLSFASYIGYLDGVCYLLDKSSDGTYQRDQNGFFPIHTASSKGHIKIVQEFLKRRPDSRELLNKQGQNILHVAAKCGKAKMITYMLKTHELQMLINERDDEGNAPLHLAAKHWHPKVVSILTWDKRVRLGLVNNDGLTAMDVAEKNIETMAPFRKQLTLAALKSANAPKSEHWSSTRANPKSFPSRQPPNREQFKERVNTLLLVSTLVATVTFASGFTMPGGYNSSGPDEGMATLITKPTFPAFVICNTIAMYSSVTVAVSLIWAQLGDLNLILTALNLALPLLGAALTMMSLAFMWAVYLVVSNLTWLAIVVLIMGSIFLITLLGLFIPLYSPVSSGHYISRYLFYYPFCLLILATRSDIDDRKD